MMRWLRMGCFLVAVCYAVQAQQLSMSKPEAVAGPWETADGHGGVIGMTVTLSTHVAGTAVSLIGQPQYLEMFAVGLYERKDGEAASGYNFYVVNSHESASWDGRHLAIHDRGMQGIPAANVALTWHEGAHRWTGTFGRGELNREVTLFRPANLHASRFVGTWFYGREPACLHIVQAADGALAGWSDALQLGGRVRFANGVHPPRQSIESYGDIAKVRLGAGEQIVVELHALPGMSRSDLFRAKISADGKKLVGGWRGDGDGSGAIWTRVAENGCVRKASGLR